MRLVATLAAALALGCEPEVKPPPAPIPHVVAQFEPTASPPALPTPNDLAFTGGDGVHLNVPDQPSDSPAQRAFNHYLNTLTGFPADSTATARFSGPLDPATVTLQTAQAPGSVVVVDLTAASLATPQASLAFDGAVLNLVPQPAWQSGHRYAVLVFGGEDPLGLRAAGGAAVLASPTFFFLRAPTPLLARCGDPTRLACTCPPEAVADPQDQTCHSVARGLSDAQARLLEPQRVKLAQALDQILPLLVPTRSRQDLVLFWTFTITAQPMVRFNPQSGSIPFPNDLLIDPVTGKVALPIAAGDPQAPLKMALNTLDGFSVSAAATAPLDLAAGASIDDATLLPGHTALLLNLDPTPGAEQPTYGTSAQFGQIAITPQTALIPDQHKYAAVLTRSITDQHGAALAPSPLTALLLQQNPLFDGMHATVSVLNDLQASQLEVLRQKLQPLFTQLDAKGLPRAQIAVAWTFTTQSIERPLAALDAFATQANLPVDVTAKAYTDFTTLPVEFQPLVADVKAVVLGTFTSQLVYDPATRVVSLSRMPSMANPMLPQADVFRVTPPMAFPVSVHYWLTIPKTTAGATAPIVIAQHGLTSWRGDLLPMGEALAKGGSATIAFDLDLHGARTRCSSDDQCLGGAGSCNLTTGVCQGGFKPQPTTENPLACVLAAFSGDTATDCKPAASGNGLLDPTNLFGGRIGGYQYVVDAAQLERVLSASGGNSLQQQLATATITPPIDPTHIRFIGQSLGGIDGAVFLATDPRPGDGNVLNVAGGHLFELLADGAFKPVIDQFLAAQHITRGTAEYAALLNTARWVLDPVDPWSVARMIQRAPSFSYLTAATNAPKLTIVQEAGMDTVIPPQYEAALAGELGWPMGVDAAHHAQGRRSDGGLVSTYFANANHGTLLSAMPNASMQTQALTYLLSAGAALPAPTP